MKGPRLTINILVSIAILFISVMVALNLHDSWSEYARSYHEQLLFITLTSIMAIFFIRAYNYKRWQRTLLMRPYRMNVRQANIWTAFMFMGVICTPVTIGFTWVEVLHYTFTIAGILFAYADVCFFYKDRVPKILSRVSFFLFAVFGMVGGKFLGLWSLGTGEFMAALPIIVHVLNTNNFQK